MKIQKRRCRATMVFVIRRHSWILRPGLHGCRATMVFVILFLAAPIQDGWKFDNAQASGVQKVVVLQSRPLTLLVQGKR